MLIFEGVLSYLELWNCYPASFGRANLISRFWYEYDKSLASYFGQHFCSFVGDHLRKSWRGKLFYPNPNETSLSTCCEKDLIKILCENDRAPNFVPLSRKKTCFFGGSSWWLAMWIGCWYKPGSQPPFLKLGFIIIQQEPTISLMVVGVSRHKLKADSMWTPKWI